jgi:lysophospholipase L1-like esterase
VQSEHTNVVDGRRVSWVPPVDPVATVWLFGGSSAFGLGQRDDHTIASELAKASWRDGRPIEVVNWGVHGDVHWMEARRMRSAITEGLELPDVVVFYDGFNELNTFNYVNLQGRAGGQSYVGSLDSTSLQRLDPLERLLKRISRLGQETGLVESEQAVTLSDEEVVAAAVRQYRSSVEETRRWLEAEGIPAVYVYQPSRATRAEPVAGEGEDDAAYLRMERSFRSQLPEAVVDLSGAMDAERAPVYWDSVHTNELGARRTADELHELLEPLLDGSEPQG